MQTSFLIVGTNIFAQSLYDHVVQSGQATTMCSPQDILAGRVPPDSTSVMIEAEPVSIDLKRRVLGALPPGRTILSLVTNVSATAAASWTLQPHAVVGCVWMPPLGPKKPIVEIARALQTDDEHLSIADQVWSMLGFEWMLVSDGPALVRMRVLCCLINEAISALADGIANSADIDRAMKLGTSYPHGPLEWANQLGLDVVLATLQALFEEFGEDRYRPSPLLKRMVLAATRF